MNKNKIKIHLTSAIFCILIALILFLVCSCQCNEPADTPLKSALNPEVINPDTAEYFKIKSGNTTIHIVKYTFEESGHLRNLYMQTSGDGGSVIFNWGMEYSHDPNCPCMK